MEGLRRSHIFAATIGNALAFYDFLIYALFAIQIGRAFFPSSSAIASLMLSLGTFGAGFLTRPLGAVVIGRYADRVGRRPAMVLCLLLLGFSITLVALVPPYRMIGPLAPVLLVLARTTQGFGLGGEVGANTAYLMEAARDRSRGVVVAWQGSSQYIALIAGSLVGVVLTTVMPAASLESYGWRIAFLLGAATVPFGYVMRRRLPETLQAAGSGTDAPAPGAANLPAPATVRGHLRIMFLGLVVLSAGTIGSYILNYIVTYAQNTLHLPARAGFIASLAAYLVSAPLMLYGGHLSDRVGRWHVNVWGNLALLLAIYPVFAWVAAAPSTLSLTLGMMLLGGIANFPSAAFYAALAEALPQNIRSTGFATVYALALACFGGTTQLVVTWLIHVTGSALAPAWYLTGATAIGQIGYMLFPETAPVRLQHRHHGTSSVAS